MNDVSFVFSKTKSGDSRKVVITASSSDVKSTYDAYANDIPHSAFINNSGSPLDQAYISNAAAELYNKLTEKPIDNSCYYDFVITVDKRHNSGAFAELWIDKNGDVEASPIVYDNDKVEIVKRSSLTYLFNYTPLIELTLADSMSIGKDFTSLFNKIYS